MTEPLFVPADAVISLGHAAFLGAVHGAGLFKGTGQRLAQEVRSAVAGAFTDPDQRIEITSARLIVHHAARRALVAHRSTPILQSTVLEALDRGLITLREAALATAPAPANRGQPRRLSRRARRTRRAAAP